MEKVKLVPCNMFKTRKIYELYLTFAWFKGCVGCMMSLKEVFDNLNLLEQTGMNYDVINKVINNKVMVGTLSRRNVIVYVYLFFWQI